VELSLLKTKKHRHKWLVDLEENQLLTLLTDYGKLEDKLKDIDVRTFDLFAFSNDIGRDRTLPIIGVHLFMQHHLDIYVNERKLAMFFEDIYKTYKRDI
jgi:hypothetical protein